MEIGRKVKYREEINVNYSEISPSFFRDFFRTIEHLNDVRRARPIVIKKKKNTCEQKRKKRDYRIF